MITRVIAPVTLFLIIGAAAWWFVLRQPEERPLSGAAQALIFWEMQRSYPDATFPSSGYMEAFTQRQAITARTTEPGTQWDPMGPTNNGGRTLAIVLNQQRPETVWAGSAGGGLWRSYSGGTNGSWERLTTGFPATSATAIAIAESDTNVVYVGTGEVYRYMDIEGGVVNRPTRGSYGIGLLKSEDGGNAWSHVLDWSLNQERGIHKVRVNPSNPDDVWVASSEGVYRSIDGGGTWTNVHPVVMAMDIRLHPTNPDWAIAAHGDQESAGKGIYRTTNGGTTWTQLTSGVPSDFIGKILLSGHPTDADITYASVGNGITSPTSTWLIRTLDGGNTWSTVSTLDYARYQGWFAHYAALNPNDPAEVWMSGVPMYRSNDGGFTAQSIGSGVHVDHHDIAFHPTDEDIVYLANDGGIYRTTNGGSSFENLNEGYLTLQFYNGSSHAETDSLFSLGGAQDNGSWRWSGTLNWQSVGGGDGAWTVIHPADPSRWCVSSQNLNFNCVNGGGAPPSGSTTAFIAPYVVAYSDPDRLYAGRSIVYRSDNFGANWTATNGGVELDGNAAVALDVARSDADVVYATTAPFGLPATVPTGVHVTTNGGDTWNDVTAGLPDRIFHDITVHPVDPQIAYVVAAGFGAGHVFKTINGGSTWTDITGSLPDAPTNAAVVDPAFPDDVYVGNDVGVFVSHDAGTTWEAFNAGLPDAVMVMDLKVSTPDRTLRVATHGNGMWKRPLGRLPVANEPGGAPTDFALESISPNPVRTDANVAFRLDRAAPIRLSVYDLRGREVAVLSNRNLAAGRHTVLLSSSRLAAGTYVVRLEAGGQTASERITVLR